MAANNQGLEWRWFVVGVVFLLAAMGLAGWAFYLKCLSQNQLQILQWALPIASGFMAWTFSGAIKAEAKGLLVGAAIVATGGFAVWLLTTYLFIPKLIEDPQCGPPPPVSVSIVRTEDLSGSGCMNGARAYENIMRDQLKFSKKIQNYDAQAMVRNTVGPQEVEISYESGGKPVKPIVSKEPLPGQDTRYAVAIPVDGDALSITYKFTQKPSAQDDQWGISVVSSLPISSLHTQSRLPEGVTVTGLNPKFGSQNDAFKNCSFEAGNLPSLSCRRPLQNVPNVAMSLYWNWDMWKGC